MCSVQAGGAGLRNRSTRSPSVVRSTRSPSVVEEEDE
jgi:hypothetical protein